MSVARIKTIAIAALVLINAFFAILIVADTAANARSERQAVENACAVLNSCGIAIDPDSVETSGELRTMKTARVDEAEKRIVQAVLGETEMTVNGVICLYENAESGMAKFYSAGDFEIWLNNGVITNESGTLRTVQAILRDMGIETTSHTFSFGQDSETVTAIGAYENASIFNCTFEFTFNRGNLQTIKGRYIAGVEPAEDGAEIMQVGTTLLGFLSWVQQGNAECTAISKVEPGYRTVSGSLGEGAIAPAWLITADSGRYLIDDATGEVRIVS